MPEKNAVFHRKKKRLWRGRGRVEGPDAPTDCYTRPGWRKRAVEDHLRGAGRVPVKSQSPAAKNVHSSEEVRGPGGAPASGAFRKKKKKHQGVSARGKRT